VLVAPDDLESVSSALGLLCHASSLLLRSLSSCPVSEEHLNQGAYTEHLIPRVTFWPKSLHYSAGVKLLRLFPVSRYELDQNKPGPGPPDLPQQAPARKQHTCRLGRPTAESYDDQLSDCCTSSYLTEYKPLRRNGAGDSSAPGLDRDRCSGSTVGVPLLVLPLSFS
jgi:hypothetical protein